MTTLLIGSNEDCRRYIEENYSEYTEMPVKGKCTDMEPKDRVIFLDLPSHMRKINRRRKVQLTKRELERAFIMTKMTMYNNVIFTSEIEIEDSNLFMIDMYTKVDYGTHE